MGSRHSKRERALSGKVVDDGPIVEPASAPPASAVAVLLIAFNALNADQQDQAFAQISEARLQRIAGEESEAALLLRSLRRVAAHVGEELSPDKYKLAYKELRAQGEKIADFNRLVRYYGSWRQAKDALNFSSISTPLKINARFRRRMVGKVGRYREETLRTTLEECATALGRVPLVIDFKVWRQKEIELAKAQGKELFLPSDSPYRRRWGSWEKALLHFGFTPEEIEARLEPTRGRAIETLAPYRYRPQR
jgi:hypothetical protein